MCDVCLLQSSLLSSANDRTSACEQLASCSHADDPVSSVMYQQVSFSLAGFIGIYRTYVLHKNVEVYLFLN